MPAFFFLETATDCIVTIATASLDPTTSSHVGWYSPSLSSAFHISASDIPGFNASRIWQTCSILRRRYGTRCLDFSPLPRPAVSPSARLRNMLLAEQHPRSRRPILDSSRRHSMFPGSRQFALLRNRMDLSLRRSVLYSRGRNGLLLPGNVYRPHLGQSAMSRMVFCSE